MQPTYYLPVIEPDDKHDEMPTKRPFAPLRCSTCLITNQTPCNTSHHVLYHVIGLGFTNAPVITIPHTFANSHNQYTGPIIEIKEYCNGVVHPITKEQSYIKGY